MLQFDSQKQVLVGQGGSLAVSQEGGHAKTRHADRRRMRGARTRPRGKEVRLHWQRYFQIRTGFLEQGATALLNKPRGPKRNYRRTSGNRANGSNRDWSCSWSTRGGALHDRNPLRPHLDASRRFRTGDGLALRRAITAAKCWPSIRTASAGTANGRCASVRPNRRKNRSRRRRRSGSWTPTASNPRASPRPPHRAR
jgi:hypothetical protein